MRWPIHVARNVAIGGTLGLFLGLGAIVANHPLFEWIATSAAPRTAIALMIGGCSMLVALGYSLSDLMFSSHAG